MLSLIHQPYPAIRVNRYDRFGYAIDDRLLGRVRLLQIVQGCEEFLARSL